MFAFALFESKFLERCIFARVRLSFGIIFHVSIYRQTIADCLQVGYAIKQNIKSFYFQARSSVPTVNIISCIHTLVLSQITFP